MIKIQCSINIINNNQNAIFLANNFVYYAKIKHIDIKHHYIRN